MPTANPVPSQDPSDLLFNAGKLDEVLNGAGNSFTDRLGVARRTVAGMNADFDAQLADAESDLNVYRADAAASAAEALGYLQTIRATSYGAYASDPATDPLGNPPTVGDEYFNTTANLLKRWNGTNWQASDINTTNLAASSGSSLVGYDGGTVQDVLDEVTGPNGAASVGYTPAGTGAVATTLHEVLRRTVSVMDFVPAEKRASVMNGTSTDDAAQWLQAAFDEAYQSINNGTGPRGAFGKVTLGGGNFYIASPVGFPDNVIASAEMMELVGDGGSIKVASVEPIFTSKRSLATPDSTQDLYTARIRVSGIRFIGVDPILSTVFNADRLYNTVVTGNSFHRIHIIAKSSRLRGVLPYAYIQAFHIVENMLSQIGVLDPATGGVFIGQNTNDLVVDDNIMEQCTGTIIKMSSGPVFASGNLHESGGMFLISDGIPEGKIADNYFEANDKGLALTYKALFKIGSDTVASNCFLSIENNQSNEAFSSFAGDADYAMLSLGLCSDVEWKIKFDGNKYTGVRFYKSVSGKMYGALRNRPGSGQVPIAFMPDPLRQSVEAASGGMQTVIYTDAGIPCYMNIVPQFRIQDVDPGGFLGFGVHPAFIFNGVAKSEIFIGTYMCNGISANGRYFYVSQPNKGVYTFGSYEQARERCKANGAGWDIMSNLDWAAIAIWCKYNGYEPTGNTLYGLSHTAKHQTGRRLDGLSPGVVSGDASVLTGSGPVDWSHNKAQNGIRDLVGNGFELVSGLRTVNGRIWCATDNGLTEDAQLVDSGFNIPASGTWSAIPVGGGNDLLRKSLVFTTSQTNTLKGRLESVSTGTVVAARSIGWDNPSLYDRGLADLNFLSPTGINSRFGCRLRYSPS